MKFYFFTAVVTVLFSIGCFGEVVGQVDEGASGENPSLTAADPGARLQELMTCNEGLRVEQWYGDQIPIEKLTLNRDGIDDWLAIISAGKDPKDGFYMYTKNSIKRCALPKPSSQSAGQDIYQLALEVPVKSWIGSTSMHFINREYTIRSVRPTIDYESLAFDKVGPERTPTKTFTHVSCIANDEVTAQAVARFERELSNMTHYERNLAIAYEREPGTYGNRHLQIAIKDALSKCAQLGIH